MIHVHVVTLAGYGTRFLVWLRLEFEKVLGAHFPKVLVRAAAQA